MNPELQDMKAAMDEMNAMKSRLEKLESVVRIRENPDGSQAARIRCESIVVMHRTEAGDQQALLIGADDAGGYLHLCRFGEDKGIAIWLGVDIADDQPKLEFFGADGHPRAILGTENDIGLMSLLGPGYTPGVAARARPDGGGSVAVLQKDGRPRAVLLHDEDGPADGQPESNLIFFSELGKTMLKLRHAEEGGLMTLGSPENNTGMILSVKDGVPMFIMRGPEEATSIQMVAGEDLAAVKAVKGWESSDQSAAGLFAGDFGSSLTLNDNEGVRRVDLGAIVNSGSLRLLDDDEKTGVELAHFAGSHSSLTMKGAAEHDCLRLLASKDVSGLHVTSPDSKETDISAFVAANAPQIILKQNDEPVVMVGQQELGGMVTAFGRKEDEGGSASLMGSKGGTLSISTRDGIPLATLDGTDHGGRLQLFNDLGFQRVLAGVHQESAVLALNNTGTPGFSAVCTEKGAIVTLHDENGDIVQALPSRDAADFEEDEDEES